MHDQRVRILRLIIQLVVLCQHICSVVLKLLGQVVADDDGVAVDNAVVAVVDVCTGQGRDICVCRENGSSGKFVLCWRGRALLYTGWVQWVPSYRLIFNETF